MDNQITIALAIELAAVVATLVGFGAWLKSSIKHTEEALTASLDRQAEILNRSQQVARLLETLIAKMDKNDENLVKEIRESDKERREEARRGTQEHNEMISLIRSMKDALKKD